MRLGVVLLGVVGCGPTYRPGALPVDAQQVGCLDIGVLSTTRREATGPVVVVYLGNRCDRHVMVDLGRLRVVGGDNQGAQVAMTAYDPAREIGPRQLDALAAGEEWIEYHGATAEQLAWLDIDVGRIAVDEPPSARWIRAALPAGPR
jgi:hypothetical protein